MSILFAGGEYADFTRVGSGGAIYWDTNGGNMDSAFARTNMALSGGVDGNTNAFRADFGGVATHVAMRANFQMISSNTSGYAPVTLFSATGNVCRLASKGVANTIYFQRWDGSAWVDVATLVWATGTRPIMFKAVCEVAGRLELWHNLQLVASYDGDLSALGGVTGVRLGAFLNSTSTSVCYTEVIAATHNILDARLKTHAVAGAGANAEWTTGAYTDVDSINEADTSFIASNAAGQKDTYTKVGLGTDTMNVTAFVVGMRCRRGASGPSGIDALVRVGGVDYAQGLSAALTETFEPRHAVFPVNPATSAAWDRTAVGALEVGAQSVA